MEFGAVVAAPGLPESGDKERTLFVAEPVAPLTLGGGAGRFGGVVEELGLDVTVLQVGDKMCASS